MSRSMILSLCAFLAPGTVLADLKVGDPAPPLKIEKWLKGKPVDLAEGKGKQIYVIEFWATWCGPCIRGIPHLSKIATHFEKSGVTVVGISIDSPKTRSRVEPFVKQMGAKMAYTVALDEKDGTKEAYLEAAGVRGIPHAFIIGKDGKIAWHGHPLEDMDIKIAEMVGDKEFADHCRKINEERGKLEGALGGEEWKEALEAIEGLLKLEPKETDWLILKYRVLMLKKDPKAAGKWGLEIVPKIEDSEGLNEFAWRILTDDEFQEGRDLNLALAAAKKANDLSEGKNWSILDTYARALFETKSVKEAIQLQKKAIEIAKKEEISEDDMEGLKESLEKYENPDKAKKGDDEKEKVEDDKE